MMSSVAKLLRAVRPNVIPKRNFAYLNASPKINLHTNNESVIRRTVQLSAASIFVNNARMFNTFLSPDMSAASTPTSTPSSPIMEPYDIVPLKVEHTEKAIQFLRKFFYRDEPLNVEQNLLETDDATCPELEHYSAKSIEDGVSLMATSARGEIVGLCLNGVLNRDEPEEDFDCPNKKFARILKLLDTVDKQADIFGQFPDVDNVLLMKILSVDSSWRGRGIAKALIDRTRELCRTECYPLMRVDCTSHYSAKAVARLGFKCVYTLKYADYKENGKPVFVPEPPHNEVKVYVQRV